MKFKMFISAVAAVFFLLAGGCVAPELYIRNFQEGNPQIKVAAILPLSGSNRIFAEQMRKGLQLAEHDINSNSVSGKKQLQFRIFDSKGSVTGAAAALDEAARWGASGIIAGYSTDEVDPILHRSAQLRMPVVIPLATATEHTMVSPFVYRNSYTDFQQSAVLANFLYHWRQAKHLGIFIDENSNTNYQGNISRDVSQHMRDIGGSITRTMMIKAIPAQEEITAMLKTDPEAILLTYGGKNAAETIKLLRNSGFTGIVCGADNWDDAELISALDNFKVGDCLYTAFFSDENRNAEYLNFKTAFRKRFYYTPGACEAQSYDALKFMVIGLAGAETLPDFDRNWRTIKLYQGAAALYTMLPKGDIDRTVYINSIGLKRVGTKIKPYARLSHKMQHSKLKEYSQEYYQ